ncbi:MAG: enoyl-CoA hydratase-related protein, partial [Alphaproteobacteria bacterium]|nr:enoyl-CoA hydratase-related protein [Alphaproteobacteria bacterium]
MAHEYVTVAREGRVATVTFDRGNRLNPLSLQAIEELTEVASGFSADLETSAIVLRTPDGSGFSAGRDLSDPAMELRRDKPMLARRHAAGA